MADQSRPVVRLSRDVYRKKSFKTLTSAPTAAMTGFDVGDEILNSSTGILHKLTSLAGGSATWKEIDMLGIRTKTIAITTSEIVALAASPKELIAAPGSDKYIEFLGGTIALIFGTTAIDDAAGDGNIQIRSDGSTVYSLTVEADGLVDAVADAISTVKPLATDVVLIANKKLELFNDAAEYTIVGGGDSTLSVTIRYRILDLS